MEGEWSYNWMRKKSKVRRSQWFIQIKIGITYLSEIVDAMDGRDYSEVGFVVSMAQNTARFPLHDVTLTRNLDGHPCCP
jgi:hypothetical protein